MTGSRIALVADNAALAAAVRQHLESHLDEPVLPSTYATIADSLTRDANGLLLLAAVDDRELEAARRLVQDICLQKLPPTLVLLSTDDAVQERLESLEPYVSRRLRWPKDADWLVHLAREIGKGPGFAPCPGERLEELLHDRLLAQTPSLVPLADRLALAAKHDVTVLLTGETGTGKTFLARLVHEHSPRKQHRLMAVPCGAISANLVESEFFGHAKGAFTGADRPKIGKFAAVGQGTLLLDEIDTLGLEQQATLLRVIETGEFEPVGSNETQTCSARLIVASNLDLEDAVERGKFRLDLYYRLNVMSFHLPPLRERVQDIAPLACGMAARFNRKFKKDLFDISPDAMTALEAYSWPGNLRQLENVVQQAVLVSNGPALLVPHLPSVLQDQPLPEPADTTSVSHESLHHQRDVIERNVIQRALMAHGYSRSRAADALGISRVTLYKKMKKYGLMKMPFHHAGS